MPSTFAAAAERADRAVIRTMGSDVSYARKVGGGTFEIRGVFELPDGNPETNYSEHTRLFVRESDLPENYGPGDRATIDGETYIVRGEPLGEGEGALRLILDKVD